MFFVKSTSIDTVDTKKFKLILAIKGNKVIVNKTFLRQFILVANSIEL